MLELVLMLVLALMLTLVLVLANRPVRHSTVTQHPQHQPQHHHQPVSRVAPLPPTPMGGWTSVRKTWLLWTPPLLGTRARRPGIAWRVAWTPIQQLQKTAYEACCGRCSITRTSGAHSSGQFAGCCRWGSCVCLCCVAVAVGDTIVAGVRVTGKERVSGGPHWIGEVAVLSTTSSSPAWPYHRRLTVEYVALRSPSLPSHTQHSTHHTADLVARVLSGCVLVVAISLVDARPNGAPAVGVAWRSVLLRPASPGAAASRGGRQALALGRGPGCAVR